MEFVMRPAAMSGHILVIVDLRLLSATRGHYLPRPQYHRRRLLQNGSLAGMHGQTYLTLFERYDRLLPPRIYIEFRPQHFHIHLPRVNHELRHRCRLLLYLEIGFTLQPYLPPRSLRPFLRDTDRRIGIQRHDRTIRQHDALDLSIARSDLRILCCTASRTDPPDTYGNRRKARRHRKYPDQPDHSAR